MQAIKETKIVTSSGDVQTVAEWTAEPARPRHSRPKVDSDADGLIKTPVQECPQLLLPIEFDVERLSCALLAVYRLNQYTQHENQDQCKALRSLQVSVTKMKMGRHHRVTGDRSLTSPMATLMRTCQVLSTLRILEPQRGPSTSAYQ